MDMSPGLMERGEALAVEIAAATAKFLDGERERPEHIYDVLAAAFAALSPSINLISMAIRRVAMVSPNTSEKLDGEFRRMFDAIMSGAVEKIIERKKNAARNPDG